MSSDEEKLIASKHINQHEVELAFHVNGNFVLQEAIKVFKGYEQERIVSILMEKVT